MWDRKTTKNKKQVKYNTSENEAQIEWSSLGLWPELDNNLNTIMNEASQSNQLINFSTHWTHL